MAITSFKGTVFEKWLTPAQAIQLLSPDKGIDLHWRSAILERLRGGRIQAVAEHIHFSGSRAPIGAKAKQGPTSIDSDTWDYVDQSNAVWYSSDLTTEKMFGAYDLLRTRFFNVRFDPEGVKALIPEPLETDKPDPATTPPTEALEDDPVKGPPVSPANLQAWYELYRRAYPEDIQTEPHALKSAQGMFHDKSVTRATIRKLRGIGHKPGPKGGRRK